MTRGVLTDTCACVVGGARRGTMDAGAVPRAAGAGGRAELGEPAAAGAVRLGRRPPVPRRPGRGEGGRLRQRRGQDAAQRGEAAGPARADAGHGHADGGEVAQVTLLKANIDAEVFENQVKLCCSFSYLFSFAHALMHV